MKNEIANNAKQEVEKMLQQMKQERDEIMVRAHLLKADAKDEWHKIDEQWEHFKAKAGQVGKEAKDASEDVSAAAKLLGEEIIKSLRRIRKTL